MQALGLDMPLAENPGALTRAQLDRDPRLPDSASVRKLARKTVRQIQIGLSASRSLAATGGGELFAHLYGGTRDLYNPLTFAVIDVGRTQLGGGARATIPFTLRTRHRLSIGVDAARQDDLRRSWANCNAVALVDTTCPALPAEKGALPLDQREIVSSVGPYVRDEIRLLQRLKLSGGARADLVRFELRDRLLADGRDDSGDRTLRAVSPMVGAVARLTAHAAAYINVGSAFETPTTTELGNQPNGSAGLNRDLQPQYSTTYETGLKGSLLARLRYDLALFETAVRDELIPFEIPGGSGRIYFRNAGRTRRRGVEVESSAEIDALTVSAAYTYSHFRFRDFVADGVQYGGNAIPGIPQHQLQGSITWRHRSFFAVAEGLTKSAVFVADANSARAAGFGVLHARLGAVALGGVAWLSPVVAVQNLLDRRYVGSVAVNAAGTAATAKSYEPAPRRTLFIGLTVGAGR